MNRYGSGSDAPHDLLCLRMQAISPGLYQQLGVSRLAIFKVDDRGNPFA